MSDISDPASLFHVKGKVALVTGGSRGLGLHAATAFLKAGAALVILTARKAEGPEGIDQAVDRLNKLPGVKGKAVGIAANVADTAKIEEMLKKAGELISKTVGPDAGIDILIANAGATWGGEFEPTPDWSTQKVLDLNVRGVFNLVRLAVPLLSKRATPTDPSRVIIVSSTAGLNVPHMGEHGTIMYSVSKAAANHLGRNLAIELGPRNMTANVIAPGFFPSKLANGLIDLLGGVKELSEMNPRGRLGEEDDIAGVMLYLASRAGSYVNGVVIPVDGGMMLSSGRMSRM